MQGTWFTLQIGGKSADVYEPAGRPRPRFGILYLHGGSLETLREQPIFARLFDDAGLACICPHGQRSWWTDRVCPAFDALRTPERHLLDDVLPFVQERWRLGPRALGLLGFSMGGQGVLRLAFKHPDLFSSAAAVAPAIEYHELHGEDESLATMYDSKEQCRQDTVLLHIHPSHYPPHIFFCVDPQDVQWYRGSDRLHEKLNALGIAHECDLTTRAGGHTWDYFHHQAGRSVQFLISSLETESRRLL